MLGLNGTIPNCVVQLNYLTERSVEEIQELWKSHSRRLRDKGVVARVVIEITKDKWQQRPVNRVHYHFVAKDDRTHDELKELIVAVCRCEMEQDSFMVHVFPFDEAKGGWNNYRWYFSKYIAVGKEEEEKHYLFRSGLGLRQTYTIGQWWTYPDGRPRTKTSIEEEMKRYAIERDKEKQWAEWEAQFYEEEMGIYDNMAAEVSDEEIEAHASYMRNEGRLYDEEYTEEWTLEDAGIVVDEDVEAELSLRNNQSQPTNKPRESMRPNRQPQSIQLDPPADIAKLKEFVSNETDFMLQDCRRVVLDQSPMFYTDLPGWLYTLRGRKRKDFLRAIDLRLRPTDFDKLKATLDRHDDATWYDAYSLLQGKPMVFHAKLLDRLDWLGWHLKHGQKRQDLLDAIEARLLNTKNQRILILLEQFHGLPRKKQESQRIAWQRIR